MCVGTHAIAHVLMWEHSSWGSFLSYLVSPKGLNSGHPANAFTWPSASPGFASSCNISQTILTNIFKSSLWFLFVKKTKCSFPRESIAALQMIVCFRRLYETFQVPHQGVLRHCGSWQHLLVWSTSRRFLLLCQENYFLLNKCLPAPGGPSDKQNRTNYAWQVPEETFLARTSIWHLLVRFMSSWVHLLEASLISSYSSSGPELKGSGPERAKTLPYPGKDATCLWQLPATSFCLFLS